ncbi:hypothetical protein AAA799B03_00354 [Marine Group I thaumarchaeote SCGC AAA799-B03]|uniref:Uncharacterized protein n=3 Tax=Marine Group I TaxID=905826 RepID=A0A087S8G2_9ARCH|nr:hypothetical protein AAA799N04_00376 [Marine Group I thaumarchaeote SCGC AAA799-N04]KFM18042.1 hypothetical protein SCCGRSA3_01396 [Marine Group I thaumarchaeote SCGC RSA3]KFM22016.1 hypothetical protein AAA799B03_00354 [Marine Group I thaumarchaeote SCGC AAA799-B03]
MKTQRTVAILAIIGSMMAISGITTQEAHADSDNMMSKMIQVNDRLKELTDEDELKELPLSKISFEMRQITKTLLEINDMKDGNDDRQNKIYSHLKDNYQTVFEKYQKEVKQYQKEKGLSITEKKLISQVIKNNQNFKSSELKQDSEKETKEHIIKTIKETNAKEDYQKMINQVGIKLANDANGGVVEKNHHKVVINEIVDSKKWDLAIPAIDRIIPQTNNDELKEKLTNIKDNVKSLLDKKEKQEKENRVLSLKSNDKNNILELIEFKENEIVVSGVLDQIYEDEIIDSLTESQEIITEFEESQTLVLESIIEDEITKSLEDVSEITNEDEELLEKEKEKQRKEAQENKSNNKSDKAKNVLKSLGNPGKSGENNSDSGKGKGKSNKP